MAVEIRPLQFVMNDSSPDFVVDADHFVPATCTYHGVITGNTGPILLVEGDWDVLTSEAVSFAWVRRQALPWNPGTAQCVGVWSDQSFGFFGIVVADAS